MAFVKWENEEEAGLAWIDAALDAGEPIPPPSSLETIRARPEFSGWILPLVTIDPAALDDAVERSISRCLAAFCGGSMTMRAAGETRLGYIAKLAIGH